MRGGIQRRLTLIISLCVLVPLLLVWGVALFLSYRGAEQSARQQQAILAELVANDFSQLIGRAQNQLNVFGNSLIRTSELLEITNDRVYPILLSSQIFREVGVYSVDGLLVASAFTSLPTQLPSLIANEPYFQSIKDGRPYYSGFNLDQGLAAQPDPATPPLLRVTISVKGADEKQVIVVGDIDALAFSRLAQQFTSQTGTDVLIATGEGQLITAPQNAQLASTTLEPQLQAFGEVARVADYQSVTGREVLGARATIAPVGWMLLLESPAETIYVDVRDTSIKMLAIIVVAIPLVVGVGLFAGGRIAQPIRQLHAGVESFGDDNGSYQPVEIRTNDELTALAQAFNNTAERLRESRAELERSNERLEQQVQERTARLQHLLQEVEEKSRVQEELLETVRRLSLPVIPLMHGMVMMPLVGEITSARAADLAPRLLHAIEQDHARIALLDISGVPIVDHNVAHALVNSARAVRLIGAEAILVGIRPEVSESLVTLGLPLHEMLTAATLEQGIALGMNRLNGRAALHNGRHV